MSEKTRIVMIDDEPDLCTLVKECLEKAGDYEVITTSNPKEAETVVKENNPHLILLDIVMPERKGTDIISSLKKDEATKHIPIIVVSGKGEFIYKRKREEFEWSPNNPLAKKFEGWPDAKGAEALAKAFAVADFLSKPFTSEVLQQVIEDTIKSKKKTKPEESGDSSENV